MFLAEALDNTLKTSDDVTQYLGLPALGVVPSLGDSPKVQHRFGWPFKRATAKTKPHLVQTDEDSSRQGLSRLTALCEQHCCCRTLATRHRPF